MTGATQPKLTQAALNRIPIPVPDEEELHPLVDGMEMERTLVDANRKLMEIYEKKIQDKLAEIWGDEKAGGVSAAAMTNGE